MKAILGGSLLLLVLVSSLSTSASVRASSAPAPNTSAGDIAGYGSSVSVSSLDVYFVQPSVTCNPLLSADQAVFWLGVKQQYRGSVGTSAFCAQGAGGPVYASYGVPGVAVNPGDLIHASVVTGIVTNRDFCGVTRALRTTLSLTDLTTGQSASTAFFVSPFSCSFPNPSSPTQCLVASSNEGGADIPLANFTRTHFKECSATTLGGTNYKIVMANDAGTAAMAKPSALSADLSSFKVRWVGAGP